MVSVMIQPFMTQTPAKMWEQIGISAGAETSWDSLYTFGVLRSGIATRKGNPIFPRLDVKAEVEVIKGMISKPELKPDAKAEEKAKGEKKEEKSATPEGIITIDDFNKVELRVAEVLEVEPVKNANRLLKLQLSLGTETRQVVSGIAEHYRPEELVGKKVICVTNLKPVKLRGELSQGMILAASENGRLVLATVSGDIPNGAKVK
jgi:methionyl-tRNA synthetase